MPAGPGRTLQNVEAAGSSFKAKELNLPNSTQSDRIISADDSWRVAEGKCQCGKNKTGFRTHTRLVVVEGVGQARRVWTVQVYTKP